MTPPPRAALIQEAKEKVAAVYDSLMAFGVRGFHRSQALDDLRRIRDLLALIDPLVSEGAQIDGELLDRLEELATWLDQSAPVENSTA